MQPTQLQTGGQPNTGGTQIQPPPPGSTTTSASTGAGVVAALAIAGHEEATGTKAPEPNPALAPNETHTPSGELHMSKVMGFQMVGDQLFDAAQNAKDGTTTGWSVTRNVVHTGLGTAMLFSKEIKDPVFGGIVAGTEGILTGTEKGMDTYQRTRNLGAAVGDGLKDGGVAAGKAGVGFAVNLAEMHVASATVTGVTTAVLGGASEATLATAGTFLGVAGEATAATVGAAAGAAVIPVTIAVGATVLAYKVSDTFIAPAVTHAMYDGVEKQISESGNTTDMKTKAATGLPVIDATHNKELFDIINRNPAEANRLSANPELAAHGITNAHDPAYIQKKLDEAKQKTDSPGGISGAWGWLKDQAGMNPDKIAAQDKNGTANIQLIAYEKQFDKWKSQAKTVAIATTVKADPHFKNPTNGAVAVHCDPARHLQAPTHCAATTTGNQHKTV